MTRLQLETPVTTSFKLSKRYRPWSGLPLTALFALLGLFKERGLAGDSGGGRLDGEPEEPPFKAVAPGLDSYSALWDRSIFTSQSTPPPPAPTPETTDPNWAADFQLSGWVRLNGRLSVYLTRLRNMETIILQEHEPAAEDTPQLLSLSGDDTILDARVKVALNGQTAWIAMSPDATQQILPPVKDNKPAKSEVPAVVAEETLVEPTTVDSRAAGLTGPVIFDASATYQSMTSNQELKTTDNYERLQNRRENLIRAFPRKPEP